MAFKKKRQSSVSLESPEALYRDLRNREIEGLLTHQGKIIQEYCNQALDKTDVALQLPTGSGKTLVGLLIAEWRRRKFNEKVVYLCPTNQLVHQVCEESNRKYGIKSNEFTGSRSEYSPNIQAEYLNVETIAITNYSSLFNTNPFFDNPDIIILDDAHAAENYISKYWSLLIEREKQDHKNLYDSLISILHKVLPHSHYSRLVSQSPDTSDFQWTDKIPASYLFDLRKELIDCLNENTVNNDLKYTWSILQDHLMGCNLYISYSSILLRPLIPPTKTHAPFSSAKQRIYMSATLGEGGELERISGVEKIYRLPVPDGWDKQGIGRRLFFFPERSLNEKDTLELVVDMIKATPRTLVLTQDTSEAEDLKNHIAKETRYKTFDVKEIERSKQAFINTDKAVAIIANRYDGIDLNGDECRLLIVKNLQRSTNLQEKFIVTRLAAGILLRDRILTRLVQAMGRCTRSATDYAAVIILGDKLNKMLLDPNHRQFLHPELQAELEYGIEQSKDKNLISADGEVIPVIITPCLKIKDDALPHTQNVCYWNLQNFRDWTLKAITVIRDLRSSFSGEADLEWRKRAMQAYKDNKIDPDSLIKYLKSNPLKNLPKD